MTVSPSSLFQISNLKLANEAKLKGVPISTGIGYFDHMIDQLNSHAQVGIGLQVQLAGGGGSRSSDSGENRNFHANQDQKALLETVGRAVGSELNQMMASMWTDSDAMASLEKESFRFCCPLDEALVECVLQRVPTNGELSGDLTPYGHFPKAGGRKHIGSLETIALAEFWKGVASESHLNITLQQIRGTNAHHVCESAFKAFSRALRTLLDSSYPDSLWAAQSENQKASAALNRQGKVARQTKETSIEIDLRLSQPDVNVQISTGIPVLDTFYTLLAEAAEMSLTVECKGDLWVDEHHTAEDVSIAIGQCLTQALGTKAGLNRMWLGKGQHNDATVEVTMDLSNRPCLGHNLEEFLQRQEYVDDDTINSTLDVGSLQQHTKLTCEMMEHVLDSLVMNGRMTVHVVQTNKPGASVQDTFLATAKAFGAALRVCAMIDCRRAGQTASSKGTLSV